MRSFPVDLAAFRASVKFAEYPERIGIHFRADFLFFQIDKRLIAV
jgi:hypothetical protein